MMHRPTALKGVPWMWGLCECSHTPCLPQAPLSTQACFPISAAAPMPTFLSPVPDTLRGPHLPASWCPSTPTPHPPPTCSPSPTHPQCRATHPPSIHIHSSHAPQGPFTCQHHLHLQHPVTPPIPGTLPPFHTPPLLLQDPPHLPAPSPSPALCGCSTPTSPPRGVPAGS